MRIVLLKIYKTNCKYCIYGSFIVLICLLVYMKCGKKCEIYSRVVGYYNPVSQWNLGKKEEFKERVEFVLSDEKEVEKKISGKK